MHGNTNINLPRPSDPDLNRALYSDYYGQCVGKGGAAVQPCGWMRLLPLWTGAVGDSQYITGTKILEEQKKFAEGDFSSPEPFLNIFDKGYRSVLDARACGGQRCLQPAFAQSDKKFSQMETLHSACVAVVRSGNERAVQRAKMSWLVKRGCMNQLWPLDLLDDLWLAWGFQANFMYASMH